jgi:Uma2 family endonuclease
MGTHTRSFTPDDILELEGPDGVGGYDLVDGQLVPVSPASAIHGRLIVEVAARLWAHVRQAGLTGTVYADASFVLRLPQDPDRVRSPDVSYVAREKVEAHRDPERIFGCVPDLAVEIDLMSEKNPGGQQRIVDYLTAGVPLVWAIDPHTSTAMAYRPDGSARLLRTGDALDGEEVVAGFRLPLEELFG